MKIVTIGVSPYHLSARGKLNSWILQYLYAKGHSVTSIVSGLNTDYFPPDENNRFYFSFTHSGHEHKIQIHPYAKNGQETVILYEILKQLNPDVVVCIGDLGEFWHLKAIKTFMQVPFQTLLVATGYSLPVPIEAHEILDDFDGILCTNRSIYNEYKYQGYSNIIQYEYVGCNRNVYNCKGKDWNVDRISAICKNSQVDNIPAIIQSFGEVQDKYSSLYIHTNSYDPGDYDLQNLIARYMIDQNAVTFPKYISENDGISDYELSNELRLSDVFVNSQIVGSTGMSVFQAISCGCWPLLPNYGVYQEIACDIDNISRGTIRAEQLLVSGLEFVSVGGISTFVLDKNDLMRQLANHAENREINKGLLKRTNECLDNYSNSRFLSRTLEMIYSVHTQKPELNLETVTMHGE